MKVYHFFIFAILFGCNRLPRNNRDTIESFDISPDDGYVLLLSTHNGVTSVLEINIDGQAPKWILKPLADEIFSCPRYSPNGEKILFIKHKRKSISESVVCISNRDGSNVRELTDGDEFVTEAVFSAKGSAVLYCSAKKYKKYNRSKTKVTSETRGFDIYAMNVDDGKETQLTNLDALGIDNLSEINERYVLFHLTAGNKSGIFSFEKDNPERVLRIFPVNGTQESNLLVNPGYAPDRFLMFVAHSKLYAMDISTHKADLIYEIKGGHLIQMLQGFHTKSRVLIKKFDEQRLTSLNTDGSEIKLINIEFPK